MGRECYALFQRRQHLPDAQLVAEVVKLLGASGDAAGAEGAWQQALAAAVEASDAAGSSGSSGSGGSSASSTGVPSAEEACLHAARAEGLAKAGQLEAAVAAVEAMLDRFSDLLPLPLDASLTTSSSSSSSSSSGCSSSSGIGAAGAAAGDDVGGEQQKLQQQRRRPHPRASPVQYMQEARNAVLAAAQAAGDQATAKRVASLATLRGLPPDVGTYNILLRGSLEHGDGLAAVQVSGVECSRVYWFDVWLEWLWIGGCGRAAPVELVFAWHADVALDGWLCCAGWRGGAAPAGHAAQPGNLRPAAQGLRRQAISHKGKAQAPAPAHPLWRLWQPCFQPSSLST